MNSDDITDVDKDSINKGVTNDEGELIPGEVGRGGITDENENNIDVPTLEEDVGGESDGIRRSTRNKIPVRDYELSLGGKAYGQQLFNVRHTKYHEINKISLQGIAVNALFAQMVDSKTDNNFTQILFNRGHNLFELPRKVCSVIVLIVDPGKRFPIFATISSTTSCSKWDILLSSTYQATVHYFPFIVFFSTHMSYGFNTKPMSFRTLTNRAYHRRADSIIP